MREQALFEATQEHDGEFQPLGRMQRHHLHGVFASPGLRLTAFQHRVRQEGVQRVHGFTAVRRHLVGFEGAGRGDEFVQVFDARLALAVFFLLEMFTQTRARDDMVHLLVQGQAAGFLGQLVHQLQKPGQGLVTLRAQHAGAQHHAAGFPQGTATFAGCGTHQVERARPDATRRQVHHALESGVLRAVRQQTQISQRVFHFGAFEEAQTPIHTVGDACIHEALFQHAGLRVGTVEHGHTIAAATMGHPFADTLHDEVCFVAFIERGINANGFTRRPRRTQGFAEAPGVVFDDAVGQRQNVAAGAIVFLEAHHERAGKVFAELVDVFHLGTTPAVNALVVVAHHERRTARARNEPQPLVLQRVGVLEFVDQHVREAVAVVREDIGMVAQEFIAAQQQFGEVHHARLAATRLVFFVDADELAARGVAVVFQMLGALAFIFAAVDEPGDFARHPAGVVQTHVLQDFFHQPLLVVRVENLEGLGQVCLAPVNAQQAMRQPVEGADPEILHAHLQQALHAGAHFGSGLVGEGDGEDGPQRGALAFDEPADAVHQHARLAGTGTGEDETGLQRGRDGLRLFGVQAGEERVGIHRRILPGQAAHPLTLCKQITRRATFLPRGRSTVPAPAR